jgi:HSP20 family protein
MSTFFEKLTGGQKQESPDDLAPSRGDRTPRRKAARGTASDDEEPRATRLKVETEERDPQAPDEAEQPAEDEGELTVDIYDKGDAIVIQSTVAGVKPEDLDISITSDSVTIRGSRERHDEVREDNYYYKELFWGTFSISVILPEEVDDDAAEASLKHGLLTIRLPKKRRGTVQKLKVKVT